MTLPLPKHYWSFNKTSGTIAADSVGSATVAIDRESFVPGKWGTALRFNPTDGARVVTTTVTEGFSPPWTAAAWVLREADTASATLLSSPDSALKLEQWHDTHAAGLTRVGEKDLSFGYQAPAGQWIYLTFVGTPSETRLYVRGQLQGTIPEAIRLGVQWIGSSQGREDFASMVLGDLEIFDEALTDAQAADLHDTRSLEREPRPAANGDAAPMPFLSTAAVRSSVPNSFRSRQRAAHG